MVKRKVLHLIWSLRLAGAESVARSILLVCREAGYEPFICALASSDSNARAIWDNSGIRTFDCFKRKGFDPFLSFRLRKLMRREGIDLLHTHNAVGALYGGWAAGHSVRHIHTEHSNVPAFRKLLQTLVARQLQTATTVADSKKVAVMMARRYGMSAANIRVIYNGVSSKQTTAGVTDSIRNSLSIPAGAKIIGTIGNLREVKDQKTLLRAFHALNRKNQNSFLIIVGEGEEKNSLVAEAATLGISERVRFTGYRSDARDILRMFDIFVLSSKSEGLPLSLLEAMSDGRPCISTSVGGIPEIIEDGVTGLLVPAESSEGIARAIDRLIAEPSEAERLAQNGKKWVSERFSEERMRSEYLSLYETLR